MKQMCRTRYICLVLGCLLLLSACNVSPSDKPEPTGTESPSIPETEPSIESETTPQELSETTVIMSEAEQFIRISGRYEHTVNPETGYHTGTGIMFDWSGSALEFNAYCEGTVILNVSSKTGVSYRVYVDGNEVGILTANAPDYLAPLPSQYGSSNYSGELIDSTLTLAEGLPRGDHSFRVVKMTMTVDGSNLESISLTGYLTEPPAQRKVYIEFCGDSLMEGYGIYPEIKNQINYNQDTDFVCSDATKSFAFLTAMNLDVDYSYLAVSGMGLKWGFTEANLLKAYNFVDFFHDQNSRYNFSTARIPDLIVMSVGANDARNIPNDIPRKYAVDFWTEDAPDALTSIRTKYGIEIPIVLVCGIFPGDMTNAIKIVANRMSNVYVCQMDPSIGGIDNHPNATEAASQAEILTEYLKNTFPELLGAN